MCPRSADGVRYVEQIDDQHYESTFAFDFREDFFVHLFVHFAAGDFVGVFEEKTTLALTRPLLQIAREVMLEDLHGYEATATQSTLPSASPELDNALTVSSCRCIEAALRSRSNARRHERVLSYLRFPGPSEIGCPRWATRRQADALDLCHRRGWQGSDRL